MKTFRVIDIADALGVSTGTVSSAANQRGWSCKAGLDINQIIDIYKMPRRQRQSQTVNKAEVELIQALIDALVDDEIDEEEDEK